MRQQTRPTAIDLFSGAGGLSLGLEQAGFDVAAAVEYDPVHAATHMFNFPQTATICADVGRLSGDEVRSSAHLGSRRIDLVAGGPPCQGFSLMGKRSVCDERNSLIFHFERLVMELEPRYFLMENVPGLLVGQQAELLADLVERFEADGYTCLAPRLLRASDFGVPQDRTRMFLVGARASERLPNAPTPCRSCPTVWDAIGDLPNLDDYDALLERDDLPATFGAPSDYAAQLRGLADDPNDFGYRRVWDRTRLTSSTRTVHTPLSVQRFQATTTGDVEPVSRFLRLDPDGLCNTLRAGTDGKRGAYTSPRPIHPVHPRVISVREAARLHGFPDWFRLHSTKWHGFRQVGNAVVPQVARAVAGEIVVASGASPVRPTTTVPLGDPELLRFTMARAADFFDVPRTVVGQRDRAVAGVAR